MDVTKAILARYSARRFKSESVPKEIILKILEAAIHSPSYGDSQPWEIFVTGREVAARIRKAYLDRFNQETPAKPEIPGVIPSQWPMVMQDRMHFITNERLKLLGIDPQDKAGMKEYRAFNGSLFNAPVLVVICMDQTLSTWAVFDIGMLSQTIMLAAKSNGVDSIVALAFVNHPDILRKELGIPDNLKIVIGIGLGYADPEHVINTYRSPRRPISEAVTIKGFYE